MQQFEAHVIPHMIRAVSNQAGLVAAYDDDRGMKLAGLNQLRLDLEALAKACGSAKMPISCKAINRLVELVQLLLDGANGQADALVRGSQIIAQTIENELSIRMYFSLNSDEAEAWDLKALFGESVSNQFPSTDYELEEETKCFAVGRYTAAVFHLMRVLEIGLSSLARSIGTDPDNKSWEQILKNIQKKLEENSQSKPADWKDIEKFYSEVSAHFRNLKNAWRNYTTHVHEKYDKDRTEEIFIHVRSIMKQLASNGISE